jgi:cellulose synthase/poly-beta-1,6-N-acetylglucosamine synthase-like glycosyltransferase
MEEIVMISIISCTIRQDCLENILQNFNRQIWEDKELIIILNKDKMDIEKWKKEAEAYPNISVFQLPESTSLGECLNFGVQKTKYPYVAKFDDDDYYSPYYLKHSMKAFEETNASVVGKTTIYMYFKKQKLLTEFNPNRFGGKFADNEGKYNNNLLMGGTLIIKKSVFNHVQFSNTNIAEDAAFCEACIHKGFKIYSTAKENYVYLRSGEPSDHTWKVRNDTLLKLCKEIAITDQFEQMIIKE